MVLGSREQPGCFPCNLYVTRNWKLRVRSYSWVWGQNTLSDGTHSSQRTLCSQAMTSPDYEHIDSATCPGAEMWIHGCTFLPRTVAAASRAKPLPGSLLRQIEEHADCFEAGYSPTLSLEDWWKLFKSYFSRTKWNYAGKLFQMNPSGWEVKGPGLWAHVTLRK